MHLCEYEDLIKEKKKMESYSKLCLSARKTHACAKFGQNLKGKHVENYSELTLMNLSMHNCIVRTYHNNQMPNR